MIIRLSGSAPPTDQIRDQIRGLIASGQLAGGDRLPSVRQLARDLGVAPGTVAKAYRALEADRFLVTRAGGGTRVNKSATATRRPVLDAVQKLVDTSTRAGVDLESTIQILRAVWPASTQESTVLDSRDSASTIPAAPPQGHLERSAGMAGSEVGDQVERP